MSGLNERDPCPGDDQLQKRTERCDLKTLLKMLFSEVSDVKVIVLAHLKTPEAAGITGDTFECVLR